MGAEEYYSATARHYDPLYASAAPHGDIAFYVDLARGTGGPVLEIGCGTGRVLLPTLEAGIEIEGLDLTPALLDILREKLARAGRSAQLHQADMRGFSLPGRYRLITVPFRPLQHLITLDDQIGALTAMHRHLLPGGLLAFNVFYPNFQVMNVHTDEVEELSWSDPQDSSVTMKRFYRRPAWNQLEQHFDIEFIYRAYRAGVAIGEQRSQFRMSYYLWPQLRLLLRQTGFEVVEAYGSFDREPIEVCKEMIVVARAIR